MKTPSRRTVLVTLGGAYASLGVLRYPANAAEFTYKLGANTNLNHPQTLRSLEAAQRVHNESGGRMEIRVFANSALGGDTAMLGQLRTGALEFQQIGDSILSTVVPAAGLDSIDLVFDGFKQVWGAMDGGLGSYIRKQISDAGLHPLAKSWDNGFKQILTNRPINSPDDLKGLKLRVAPSPIGVAFFKAFNVSPVPLNYTELYTAIQSKLLDGAELALSSIEDGKFSEITKYVAITNHYWIGVTMVANGDAWQRLPKNLQDLVERSFDDSCVRERDDLAHNDAVLAAKVQSEGMTVTRPDLAPFRAVMRKSGLFAQWKEGFGTQAWALLEKSVGRTLA